MKWSDIATDITTETSPSTRREWIEIVKRRVDVSKNAMSPSTRREWIEMGRHRSGQAGSMSPSTRREWIEIICHARHNL